MRELEGGLNFALAILVALCAECIPVMLVLAGMAVAVTLGGKSPSVCEFRDKNTAPGGKNTESGTTGKANHEYADSLSAPKGFCQP